VVREPDQRRGRAPDAPDHPSGEHEVTSPVAGMCRGPRWREAVATAVPTVVRWVHWSPLSHRAMSAVCWSVERGSGSADGREAACAVAGLTGPVQ
jgi:hypothetical protein